MSMQNIWSVQTHVQAPDLASFNCDVTPAAGAMGAYVIGVDLRSVDDATLGWP
jgi:hypothetical protein